MSDNFRLLPAKETISLFDAAIKGFKGDSSVLESAIGAYMLGRNIGWKPLLLIHDKKTLRKYEVALGVNFREHMAAEGPFAAKSVAYKAAIKLGNFWKAVSGHPGIRTSKLDAKG